MNARDIIDRLHAIRERRLPIGYDLEGLTFVSCQAFAESPTRAFCVVTDNLGEHSCAIWGAVTAVLEDPLVPKWVWNAHHELAVLKMAHGITLRGWEDGMALWFERFCELPKGLKYAASILTRRPCWTEGISFDDDEDGNVTGRGEAFYRYNMHDAASTLELSRHPQIQPTKTALERYNLRKTLIEALTWSSLKGIRYDREAAATLRAQLEPRLWLAQAHVNDHAGTVIPTSGEALFRAAVEKWCHKVKLRKFALPDATNAANANDLPVANGAGEALGSTQAELLTLPTAGADPAGAGADPGAHLTPSGKRRRTRKPREVPVPVPLTWKAAYEIAVTGGAEALAAIQHAAATLERVPDFSDEADVARAQIAHHLKRGINVKSSGSSSQVIALLDELGLPKVYRHGERGDESARTKDADTLLDLYLRTGHPVTVALLTCIALRTQLQELDRKVDADGHIRCSFVSCGTTTDRTTSKAWLTGSGGNLQTVPREPVNFRVCYKPDLGPAPGDESL